MINFFRKIRYRLAKDNQFLKYSRYAVGEILLVVVGILIALYINNWNEERKDSKFERKMLLEVKKTMEQDLIELKYYKERNAAKKKGIQELLKISASGHGCWVMIQRYPFEKYAACSFWDSGLSRPAASISWQRVHQ